MLKLINLASRLARLGMAVSRSTWPIIVGGCHRSGTSLIRRILNSHSHIHCGPEVKFFRDFYGDYLNDPIRHGRFMASARSVLPEGDLLEVLGRAFVALHERAAGRAGKPRWADKNPENVLYLDQWGKLLSDEWLMIHCVRNPLDTLASIKEVRFPFVIPADLNARIDFYDRYTRAGLDFGSIHPGRYYRVLYEQLVSSPRTVLEGMMQWLGEEFEPEQMEFNRFPHQSGLEDPKISDTHEIHSESVGRWRAILSPEEALAIRSRTLGLWSLIDPDGRYTASF